MFHATPIILSRKYFFGVRSPESEPTLRYTFLDSRVALCNAISEGRPPLRNTSLEAGAVPSKERIENDSDRKFSKSKIFKVFLETTSVHVSSYPDHYEPKIVFGFQSPHLPFDKQFWT